MGCSMRALAAIGLAAVGLAASAGSAAANWQYTHWGMKPAEVKAASQGALRDNGDRSLDSEDLKARLAGPFTGEATSYTAVFLFDDENKLKDVTLTPVTAADCPMIRTQLRSHYGDPVENADMIHAGVMRWGDFEDKNLVVFLQVEKGGCTIQYSKLPNTRPDGDNL